MPTVVRSTEISFGRQVSWARCCTLKLKRQGFDRPGSAVTSMIPFTMFLASLHGTGKASTTLLWVVPSTTAASQHCRRTNSKTSIGTDASNNLQNRGLRRHGRHSGAWGQSLHCARSASGSRDGIGSWPALVPHTNWAGDADRLAAMEH